MCIYTITHRATGRIYVGQTTLNVKRRWQSHCAPSNKNKRGIGGAIAKYGKDSFDFNVIDIAESREQLNHKERFWISELKTSSPLGFNLDAGGNLNKSVTLETRQRQRDARAKWLASGADTSVLGNGARGRKRRPEEIAAISIGLTGRHVSVETRERSATTQRGVPKSDEYTLRMARSRMKGFTLHRSDGLIFLSYMEAARSSGVSNSAIHNAANGKTKSSGGFYWLLVRDDI
jgi:group I intron endonuclease